MSERYNFVEAATKTVIEFLKEQYSQGTDPGQLKAVAYYAPRHEAHLSALVTCAEEDYHPLDVPKNIYTDALVLCLDMADWERVCEECGIVYIPGAGAFEGTRKVLERVKERLQEARREALEAQFQTPSMASFCRGQASACETAVMLIEGELT